jgi:hypothetical protein
MSASAPVLEGEFSGLIAAINRADCVLVLGPRVMVPDAATPAGKSVAMDEYIAGHLLQKLSRTAPEPGGLRAAVSLYEREKGLPACRSQVQNAVSRLDGNATQLHRNLASLPFKLVLSATPDQMMVEALRQAGKEPQWDCYNYCPGAYTAALLAEPTVDKPIVYSLFGRHDRPESMVLNDKNLLDFLVNITRQLPALPDAVRATLHSSSTVFLFVGFGFTNWWLRLLLKVLEVTGVENRGISLALEDKVSFDEAVYRENLGFFESLGIYIQARDDWDQLASDLAEKFRAQAPKNADGRTAKLAAGVRAGGEPMAFLSYASEDVDTVEHLRMRLASHGIAVWQDKQNLRSGQNWEHQIVQIIERVDAFIFVQTPNMDRRDAKRGGVYNRELDEALEYAKDLPFGRVFVHHVTVGNCRPHPHPKLQKLHRLALDSDAAIDQLASDVLQAKQEAGAPS